MSMRALLRSLLGAKRSRTISRKSSRYRPMLELLEDRLAPAAFLVDSNLDTDNGLAFGNGPTTLRKAIRLANVDAVADTISFAAALTGQTIILGGTQLPTITKPVTIAGLGSDKLTIDAANLSRFFNIDDTNFTTSIAVSISGLKLAHGKADDNNTGTVGDDDHGGAIFNKETLTLASCWLDHNLATVGAGGIFNVGSLTIANSILSGNRSQFGGAISNSGGTVVVTNSTFSANLADFGAGMFLGSGTVSVTNSTLSANIASTSGGAIHNVFGTITLKDSTLSGNSANSGDVSRGGGAIFDSSGIVILMNSTLINNHAAGEGGAIREDSGAVRMTNSILSGNSAQTGGGIYGTNVAGSVALTNSTLANNSTVFEGGGIFNNGSTATLANSTLSGNTSSARGGGIYNFGVLTLTNSTLDNNFARGDGGGIANLGILTLTNSTLSGNSSQGNGGGIYNAVNLTLANSTIVANRANSDGSDPEFGGGIYTDTFTGTNTLLFNSIVAGNLKGFAAGTPDDFSGHAVSAASVNNLIGTSGTSGLNNSNGGNIVGKDNGVNLLPLAEILDPTLRNNGGPTQTHALIPGSAAIDAGSIAAVSPASEVQTITLTGTFAGSFTLSFNGQTTVPLVGISPTLAADTQSALNALPSIGGVDGLVTVIKVGNVLTVTFGDAFAFSNVLQIVATGSGGLITNIATTTDGRSSALAAAGFSEVQSIGVKGTSGTFTLTFNGQTTAALPFNVTPAQMQTALNTLATIGGVRGSVTVTKPGNTFIVTFGGTLANTNVPQLSALVVGAISMTLTTSLQGFPAPTDQRGGTFSRVVGTQVDIGAYEMPRAYFIDFFNRAFNRLSLGAPWVNQFGGIATVGGSRAQGTTVNVNVVTLAGFVAADVDLYAGVLPFDINPPIGGQSGLVGRFVDVNNYYAATMTSDLTGLVTARLVKFVNGVYTELAVAENTPPGGFLRLRIVGNTLQMYLDGTLLATAIDFSLVSGSVGMRTFGPISQLLAFQAWPIATGVDKFDSFTQANNVTLDDPWVQNQGFFRTVGNRMQGGQALNLATLNAVQAPDVDVQASVSITGINHHASLLARYQSTTDSGYQATLSRTASGFVAYLFIRINGNYPTQLAMTTIASITGNTNLRFLVTGSNLKLFVNSILVFDVLDTTLMTGTVGIRSDNYGFFDDFCARAVTSDLPFTDAFTQSDGDSLSSRWTRRTGDFKVIGGKSTASSPATLSIATLAGVKEANLEVQADIALPTVGNHAALLASYDGVADTNYYMGLVQKTAAGFSLFIFRNSGGAFTQLATNSVAGLMGPIKFRVQGTTLTLFMNGVQQLTATDSTFPAGGVGIRCLGAGTIDNFSATPLTFLPYTDAFPSSPTGLSSSWVTLAGGYATNAAGAVDKAKGTTGVNHAALGRLDVADVDLQATINVPNTNNFAALTARVSSAADPDFYQAVVYWTGTQFNADIFKRVGGVFTQLGTTTLASGAGVLRFTVIGSQLKLFFGGVEKLSVSDFSLKSGSVGIRSSLDPTLDDFSAAKVN